MATSLPNLHLLASDSYVLASEDTVGGTDVVTSASLVVGPCCGAQGPQRQLPQVSLILDPSNHFQDQSLSTPLLTGRRLVLNAAALGTGTSLVTGAIAAFLSLASSTVTPSKSHYYLHPRRDILAQMCSWIFGMASVSGILGPCVVRSFSAQWTLVASSLTVVIFLTASVLLVEESALFVSGMLLGSAIGPMDAAYNASLLALSSRLAVTLEDGTLERISRLCAFLKRTGHAFVHLLTAFILAYTEVAHVTDEETSCGVLVETADNVHITHDFLHGRLLFDEATNTTSHPSTSMLNSRPHRGDLVLVSVYLGCTLLGVAILTAFLDKLNVQRSQSPSEPTNIALIWEMVSCTRDTKFWLATPIMLFLGLQEGFLYDDFIRWYVGCSLGSAAIARIMFTYSVMQGLASVGTSHLAEHGVRAAIATAAATCYVALLAILLLWKPDMEDAPVFYVVAAGWGLCIAVWDTLTFGLLTSLQSQPWAPLISTCSSLRFLGICVAFAAHCLQVRTKIYALAAILAASIIPYAFLEHRMHQYRHMRQILTLI